MIHFDHIIQSLGKVHGHNIPAAIAILIGLLFVFFVFKAEKLFSKLMLLFVALCFFAAAGWWCSHISS